nr:retroviral-like aspartic protease family protein [Acetobacter fallax]
MPVLNSSHSPVVQVTLNGKPVAMIVDTGADASLVSTATSEKFDLSYTGGHVTLRGTTGVVAASVVRADKLGLGKAIASDVLFIEIDKKWGHIGDLPVAGLLGSDFLSNYEVKFDLPQHLITLYRMQGCSSKDIVWKKPVDPVPLEPGDGKDVLVPFKINGKPIDAILDSGASGTVIRPSQARKAGVTRDMLARDPVGFSRGVSDDKVVSHRHLFDTVEVGPEIFHNVHLQVAPLETDSALLGADFLRHAVVWLSYRDRILYIERPQKRDAPGNMTDNVAGNMTTGSPATEPGSTAVHALAN